MTDEQAEESLEQLNKNGDTRGMHPNSRKNLKPNGDWKPGVSGNPKGSSFKSRILQLMGQECPYKPGKTWEEAFDDNALRMALDSPRAVEIILDRLEGKVTQPISGAGGSPLIPHNMHLILADGTEIKPPRNGQHSTGVGIDDNGHGE